MPEPRFVGAPPSPVSAVTRRKAASATSPPTSTPSVAVPPVSESVETSGLDKQDSVSTGSATDSVVASTAPDDDLSDYFPPDITSNMAVNKISSATKLDSDKSDFPGVIETIIVHILEDGFTAAGRVWYRGQELEYTVGEQSFEDTKDRLGVSWLLYDDSDQMRHWGRVMFRRGPWPGLEYEDSRAASAERTRGRRPPALAGIAPPRHR